jgi:hypothetical protein
VTFRDSCKVLASSARPGRKRAIDADGATLADKGDDGKRSIQGDDGSYIQGDDGKSYIQGDAYYHEQLLELVEKIKLLPKEPATKGVKK